ncbi:hypothetical protein JCM10213_007293 [Rhodosporidiobolus nylandii]
MDGLLPLNSATVALSALGTMTSTMLRHYVQRKKVTARSEARNSLLYDEAFSVMKMFFEKSALHTVEEAQEFGNNFVPAPFWVRVIRVVIPLSTRLEAGKILIAGIGEEDIQKVVGGREWWQRTAHADTGVDGEWISLKRDWEGLEKDAKAKEKAKRSEKGKGRAKDEDWEDDLREARLKALKQAAKEDAKRRRKEGKARAAATPGAVPPTSATGPETETDSDAERSQQRRAASEQRNVRHTDDLDETASRYHQEDSKYTSDMDDMPVVLAIHGGGYFFGSINTHRYVYWRLARKTGGRVFAVEYRLAPQYPFPCGLHDCLSAYLYLIRPPPGAKHRAVDPSKITICGDSAGGGMTLALLCLLRDAGLPMPAGAILISPWCDLTHSFPSILENTETDIPPPYGFGVFKPSTLWPPPPPEFRIRAAQSTTLAGLKEAAHKYSTNGSSSSTTDHMHGHHFGNLTTHKKAHELADAVEKLPDNDPKKAEQHRAHGPDDKLGSSQHKGSAEDSAQHKAEVAEVIRVKVDGEEIELKDQIQLYATNEQLVYPFVSPIWQPSLGGLPPLYIMAGDKEVLRDEIVYMAHRAAHPDKYPVREGILKQNPERSRRAKDYPPTKVHLQVYDDVCHDLPLFSFTTPAKYCFRAMASFAKWITTPENEHPGEVPRDGMSLSVERDPNHPDASSLLRPPSPDSVTPTISSRPLASSATSIAPSARSTSNGSTPPSSSGFAKKGKGKQTSIPEPRQVPDLEKTIYSSTQPFNRPEYVDGMIRERISITGVVRPMEAIEDMLLLKLDKEDIGLIKEAPVKRYLAGKAIWDRKFRRDYIKVQKERERHLKKSMKEEATRITERVSELSKEEKKKGSSSSARPNPAILDPDTPAPVTDSPEPLDIPGAMRGRATSTASIPIGLEGSWDLHGENPPPSSLAGRKDTAEARKLAKVLDEHYSRLHALNLWSEIHDIVGHAPRQRTGQYSAVEAVEA